MSQQKESNGSIIKRILSIAEVPDRNPTIREAGKQAFLHEAQKLNNAQSGGKELNRNNLIKSIQSVFTLKAERSPIFSKVATALLILILVFGSGSLTVAAAQSSQPETPLYSVKLLSENIQIGLMSNPESQYELALAFTNRRAVEIQTIVEDGAVPSAAVQSRYQDQVERSIQFALNLPVIDAVPALKKIRTNLRNQEQLLTRNQTGTNANINAAMDQIRNTLREQIQWVEQGIENPGQFRSEFQMRYQNGLLEPTGISPTHVSFTPGENPWVTGTPTPGSGYGPGPGPNPTNNPEHTPQGPGPNPTNQPENTPQGPGPNPTNQPDKTPQGPGPKPTNQPENTPKGPGPQATQGPKN